LSYATQNHRLLRNSPLSIIPPDLLLLILHHFGTYERQIGTFRIPQINLRLDLSPINILRERIPEGIPPNCAAAQRIG